jgi:hypothetical protein
LTIAGACAVERGAVALSSVTTGEHCLDLRADRGRLAINREAGE